VMDDSDREHEEALAFLENYEGAPLGRQIPRALRITALVVLSFIAAVAALVSYWIGGQP